MVRRIRFKSLLALNGVIDLLRRDRPLFHKSVRDHRRDCALEKIQYPMVNSSQADAQFVDPIAQEIRFGPPQFVAHFTKWFQTQVALVLYLPWQTIELLDQRARFIFFLPLEDDFSLRHSAQVYSQYCEIANLLVLIVLNLLIRPAMPESV